MATDHPDTAQVVIVDDEPFIRDAVVKLLACEGIAAVAAENGDECLDLLRKGFRGVILMDVMMPYRNGWQTIRAMADESLVAGNIISMLTSVDEPDEQMEGLQELVFDYITKPFEPSEMIATVRTYLGCLEQMRGGN
ncbi:response regulator [Geobacter hydrogenophilus]|uniref:Response regulator n=1 Tax=Geobacter hydrogenophilus TaxID=40983 RepID=A0A9W6FYW0_9BACT|nr:response regulator [Geobacter hydrogenophilus]MBT0895553.1 response regulator [Geobacter hydrogenophilus]GLI37323.1 response regulator [Geobacter hydrogenophilus]